MRAKTLTIRFNEKVIDYLDQLVGTGLYGTTREECAERLVCEALHKLFAAGNYLNLAEPNISNAPSGGESE